MSEPVPDVEPCRITAGAFCLVHWSRADARATTCDHAKALGEVRRLREGIEDMKVRALDHRQIVTEGPLVGRILVAHWCDKVLNPTEGDPRE